MKDVVDLGKVDGAKEYCDVFFTMAQAAHVEGLLEDDPNKRLFGMTAKTLLAYIQCIPDFAPMIVTFIFSNYGLFDNPEKQEVQELIEKLNKEELSIGSVLDKHKNDFLDTFEKFREVAQNGNE